MEKKKKEEKGNCEALSNVEKKMIELSADVAPRERSIKRKNKKKNGIGQNRSGCWWKSQARAQNV